jgi:hypothetical protein
MFSVKEGVFSVETDDKECSGLRGWRISGGIEGGDQAKQRTVANVPSRQPVLNHRPRLEDGLDGCTLLLLLLEA